MNAAKSAGARPWHRPGLGFTGTRRQPHRRPVREQALQAFNATGRERTGRTRARTLRHIVTDLRQLRRGWRAVFGFAEARAPLRDLDQWIRRRLRHDPWQPWGRKRYQKRRTRGVGRPWAWHTGQSAPGPWRLRQSPARAMARSPRYVAALGLPSLVAG